MDDYRLQRRRNIKSLLFGKSSFCRRFESSPENSFREKNGQVEANFEKIGQAEANLRKSVSQGSDGASSEGRSSPGSVTSKRWKSPLVRSLSWIKWNFLSSLSKYCNPSHPPPFRISSFPVVSRKHPISTSYEKIKPCIESGIKMIEQRKSGFEYLEKRIEEMPVKRNIEAKLCKEPVNCSSPTSNTEDAGECESSENKLEDGEIRISCCSSEKEKCGADDDVEEDFEQKALHGCPTEEHVSHRKKTLRRFPPPLPSLARTGNLPSHMPWVHLRSYKRDGRLVIQEVKVQHHEFFRAKRCNGRLTMHLVQHDEGKIRAHHAEKAKAEQLHHGTGIDPSDQNSVDEAKENDTIEIEEAPGETMDELPHNGGDKDGVDEAREETLGLDNGDKDTVVEKEEVPGFNGDFEDLKRYGVEDNFSANIGFDETQARLPRPIRVPVQQCFAEIGLESPIGCCAPPLNPLFGRSMTAIRPIRS